MAVRMRLLGPSRRPIGSRGRVPIGSLEVSSCGRGREVQHAGVGAHSPGRAVIHAGCQVRGEAGAERHGSRALHSRAGRMQGPPRRRQTLRREPLRDHTAGDLGNRARCRNQGRIGTLNWRRISAQNRNAAQIRNRVPHRNLAGGRKRPRASSQSARRSHSHDQDRRLGTRGRLSAARWHPGSAMPGRIPTSRPSWRDRRTAA